MLYEVLIPVSRGYPSVWGRLPTRYSPVRRFPLSKSTEASFNNFSLDLHVLGTPPAFILSQDQTLKFNSILTLSDLYRVFCSKRLRLFANPLNSSYLNYCFFTRNCQKPFCNCLTNLHNCFFVCENFSFSFQTFSTL